MRRRRAGGPRVQRTGFKVNASGDAMGMYGVRGSGGSARAWKRAIHTAGFRNMASERGMTEARMAGTLAGHGFGRKAATGALVVGGLSVTSHMLHRHRRQPPTGGMAPGGGAPMPY